MKKIIFLLFIFLYSSLANAQSFDTKKIKNCSVGTDQSFAIDNIGGLWAWGKNSCGQLGDGTKEDKYAPMQIKPETKFSIVSSGDKHTLAIDIEGNLWAWGNNDYGQLGDGSQISRPFPIKIMDGVKFKSVAGKYIHSLAIDVEGNLWAWGCNYSGQIGDGTTKAKFVPVQIKSGTKFKMISAEDYSLAIDELGNLWGWGGYIFSDLVEGTNKDVLSPIQIMTGTIFKFISAGRNYFLAIDVGGHLIGYGSDIYGQLGSGFTFNSKFKVVSAGYNSSFAIDEGGNLWAWGNNPSSMESCYMWTSQSNNTPTIINSKTKFNYVAVGERHVMGISESGNLWAWGSNCDGRLGIDTNSNKNNPIQISFNVKFKNLYTYCYSSFALDESGILWTWGENYGGYLGNGTTISKTIPTQVHPEIKFKTFTCGGTSLGIDESGILWAWGGNLGGSVGNGSNDLHVLSPAKIKADTKFKLISSGDKHNMAIDVDGNLWSWGYNGGGASSDGTNNWCVGDGTNINRRSPVLIKSGTKFKSISAGLGHSLAIDVMGGLWAWGNNGYGQLGDGTFIDKAAPVQIMTGTKFQTAEAAYGVSCAIDELGNLWSWGWNKYGQLGDGTKINKCTPVQVLQDLKFMYASCRASASVLGIDVNGKLWVLGGDRPSPENIMPDKKFKFAYSGYAIDENDFLWNWKGISIMQDKKIKCYTNGNDFNMVIDENGNIWTWGFNNYGQLGDGEAWYSNPIWLNNQSSPDAIIEYPVLSDPQIKTKDISAFSINNHIIIQTRYSAMFNIYNLQGCKVISGRLPSGETSIPIKSGFYILCIDKFRSKILVK